MSLRPILLAIVGDSAAGKSTLGDGIAALLGDERVTVVTTDDYHKHNRQERRELRLSALHPDCNDLDLLGEHLEQLANGNAVEKARTTTRPATSMRRGRFAPAEFLIVEGLLGLHSHALRDRYDVSVYLDTPEPLRHRWKVSRDTAKRGYSPSAGGGDARASRAVSAEVHPSAARARRHGRALSPGAECHRRHEALHATLTMRDQVRHPALRDVIEESPLRGARDSSCAAREPARCSRSTAASRTSETAQAEQALMRSVRS